MDNFHIEDEEMANHMQDNLALSVDDWTAVAIVGGVSFFFIYFFLNFQNTVISMNNSGRKILMNNLIS